MNVDAIKEDVENGATLSEIRQKYSIGIQSIQRLIKRHAIIKNKKRIYVWLHQYNEGESINQIAIKAKVSRNTVVSSFEKLNIEIELYPKKKHAKTKLIFAIRNLKEYKIWRTNIFERDNYQCRICKKRGIYIEAHHKIELSKIIQEEKIKTIEEAISCNKIWYLENGITLCKDCHDKQHILTSIKK